MDTLLVKNNNTKAKTVPNITGSEAVIQCLLEEKVDTLFGYPGGAIMPVYDAMYHHQDALKHILVRHEQGATHAAQGYARVSGKVGVCIATSGPGATNMITGIADALIDSTPIVCITGQVFSHLLGTDAFQETDVVGISKPVTKWNFQITSAEEIPEIMAKAFYIARSGRPGPVLIDITKDAQVQKFDFSYEPCQEIRSYKPTPVINKDRLEQAAELINNAKKPFIIFGQGVQLSGAQEELKALIEKTGIPCAATILGISAIANDHPLYMGMLGMHGNYAPNILTNECDVLIAVGMRFDDRVTGDINTYAKQAKVIHIEIDKAEINKIIKTDVAVNADAKEALSRLFSILKPGSHPQWLKEFEALREIENKKVINQELSPGEGKITMGEAVNMLSELTNGDSIVVSDVGQHQMVTQRYYGFKSARSNVTSGGLGTMGFALPAAMGAKLALPKREVIAIIGDGGFQMTIQELATVFQYQIPLKIIILNNQFLGMVRQWQQMFFEKRYAATELVNPEFEKVAQSFGINAEKVTERSDLKPAFNRLLDYEGPYLLNIGVEQENSVFPMIAPGDSVSDIRLE
jgi:acetolactate synthase-1/2/3 large subunit